MSGFTYSIGTSGHVVPLLDTANAWSLTQTNLQGWNASAATGYQISGSTILACDATYTHIYDPSGVSKLFFGNASDPASYFDNEVTYFRSAAGSFRFQIGSAGFYPSSDNVFPIGGPSNRVTVYYGVSSAINTSDATEKRILDVPEDAVFEAVLAVPQTLYQWNEAVACKGEDGARLHYGPTAQAVRDAFIKYDIDPKRYALFCVDPIMENESYEENGVTKVRQIDTGKIRLGLRLDQFDRLRTEAVRRLLVKNFRNTAP